LTSTPKKKKRKAPSSSSKKPTKRKAGTQPPYRLSEELQEIVGEPVLPRPQVVSKIWSYIKEHQLQNEQDRREILCDDLLFAVMKKPKVSMFQMNQLITPHLLEKADRSEYVHGNEDSD
jgi:upstream activation factor subunit UAF30